MPVAADVVQQGALSDHELILAAEQVTDNRSASDVKIAELDDPERSLRLRAQRTS